MRSRNARGYRYRLIACIAIATFLWNNRRLPDQTTPANRQSHLRVHIGRLAERLTDDDPEIQAGFFFTWQTLTRSRPHRTVIAIGAAAGLTHLLIVLATSGVHRQDLQSASPGLLAIDVMLALSLLAGFRYAVTVPPEVAANWTLRMAWLGDERGYLTGAKRAALFAFAVVPLLLLLPLHIVLLGLPIAVVHSIFGCDRGNRHARHIVSGLSAIAAGLQLRAD